MILSLSITHNFCGDAKAEGRREVWKGEGTRGRNDSPRAHTIPPTTIFLSLFLHFLCFLILDFVLPPPLLPIPPMSLVLGGGGAALEYSVRFSTRSPVLLEKAYNLHWKKNQGSHVRQHGLHQLFLFPFPFPISFFCPFLFLSLNFVGWHLLFTRRRGVAWLVSVCVLHGVRNAWGKGSKKGGRLASSTAALFGFMFLFVCLFGVQDCYLLWGRGILHGSDNA